MPNSLDNLQSNFEDLDPDLNYFNQLYRSIDGEYHSNYCTVDQLIYNSSDHIDTNIFVLNVNVRSYSKNGHYLEVLISSLNRPIDVIIVTETWFDKDMAGCEILDGYIGYHCVREGRRGGGVSVFLRSSLAEFIVDCCCSCTETIEYCCIKIKLSSETISIMGI